MNKFNISEGDIVEVFTGTTYKGKIVEILAEGIWLTEDYETEEYIAFVEIETSMIQH